MVPFARTQQEPLELSPEQQRLDRLLRSPCQSRSNRRWKRG